MQYEGSLPWRKRERERCSSEAQPHLLFMTHRKSFSMSSRWYPESKHNMQPSAGPVGDSEMGRGQLSRGLLSVWCPLGVRVSHLMLVLLFLFLFLSPLLPLSASQLPPSSPRLPRTRSACQGVWRRSCARPTAIPSLLCTGTRRARRSTPSVSRWLSQCSMFDLL